MQSWSVPVRGDEAVQLVETAKEFLASVLRMTTAAEIQLTQIFVETSGLSNSTSQSSKFSFDLDLYQQILSPNCIVKMEDEFIVNEDDEQHTKDLGEDVIAAMQSETIEGMSDHVLVQLEGDDVLPLIALTQPDEEKADGQNNGEIEEEPKAELKEETLISFTKGGVQTRRCVDCDRQVPVTHTSRHARSCTKLKTPSTEMIVQEPRPKTGTVPVACKTCGKQFTFMRNLRSHRLQAHKEKCNILCTECSQKFFNVEERSRHMLDRHGRRLHCDVCDFKTQRYDECVDHLKGEHQVTAEDGHIESLLSSDREVVKRQLKEACEHCGKRFSPSTLLRHQDNCTGETKIPASKLTYLCMICGKSLRYYTGLQNHIKHVHHKEYPYSCPECSMAYTHEIDKDHHCFSAHGLNPNNRHVHQCTLCPFKALRKYYLTKHMKGSHKGNSHSFVCKVCGKEFQKLSGLRTHQIRHKVEKHQCQKCGLKCSLWKTYLQHMNTQHKGWREHACPGNCGFRAGDRGSLNKHAKTCKKFSNFYATIWNEELGVFQCQNSGCAFFAYNKHVFFKHLRKCGETTDNNDD